MVSAELGLGIFDVWQLAALGELELALGRPAEAVEHFEAQASRLRALGWPTPTSPPLPSSSRHISASGEPTTRRQYWRHSTAKRAPRASPGHLPAPPAATGSSRAAPILIPTFRRRSNFTRGRPTCSRLPAPGSPTAPSLRRGGQRVRAREELNAALETFDRLGALPWAGQATAELAASGATARRRDPSTLDELTPQELQVALLLAEGKTTRETAAALFLSPKTIEYHLRHIYRKLGIHSREELAVATRSSR